MRSVRLMTVFITSRPRGASIERPTIQVLLRHASAIPPPSSHTNIGIHDHFMSRCECMRIYNKHVPSLRVNPRYWYGASTHERFSHDECIYSERRLDTHRLFVSACRQRVFTCSGFRKMFRGACMQYDYASREISKQA